MVANGRLPDSMLAPIAGGRLAKPEAARWNRMNFAVRAAGLPTVLPDGPMSSYRTLAQQVYLRNWWCARGRCGNAAVPGSSNHGLGRAVDTTRRGVAWAHGARFGVRPPTDAPWEAWHALVHLDPLPQPSGPPVLRRGTTDRQAVRRLQRILRALNLYGGPVDGSYGIRTRRGVRRFQKAHGLPVDSVVGPKTWALLIKRSGGKQ